MTPNPNPDAESEPTGVGCLPQAHGDADPLEQRGPCQLCGRPRCWQPVRHGPRKGRRCAHNPTPGGSVCTYHGANEAEREAGRRRLAEERLSRELFDADAPPVRDVTASALRLAGKLEAMVDRVGARLNGDSLSPEDRAFFTAITGQLGPLLTRLGALRLGERELELAREQLQLVRVGLGRAAAAAELGAGQRATLFRVFAAEIRSAPLEIEEGDR